MAATFHHHHLLLHHLFRPTTTTTSPPRSSAFLSLLLLKPTLSLLPQPSLITNFLPSLSSSSSSLHSSTPPFLCNSFSSSYSSSPSSLALSLTSNVEIEAEAEIEDEDEEDSEYGDEIDEDEDEDEDEVGEEEEEEIVAEEKEEVKEKVKVKPPVSAKLPSLSVKEKKELASYAHGLGDKLKSQLVGKSGVTDSVAASFVENLESNELLKIKIHRTCPGELPDVVKQLEDATAALVVSQIGRTVILYRPSLTKLKAEEKKLQNRRVFIRKSSSLRPTLPSRKNGPVVPRVSGRGHRGGSRV